MTTPINGVKTADAIPGLEYMCAGHAETTATITERLDDYRTVNSLVNGGFSGPGRSNRRLRVAHCGVRDERKVGTKALILADPLV